MLPGCRINLLIFDLISDSILQEKKMAVILKALKLFTMYQILAKTEISILDMKAVIANAKYCHFRCLHRNSILDLACPTANA